MKSHEETPLQSLQNHLRMVILIQNTFSILKSRRCLCISRIECMQYENYSISTEHRVSIEVATEQRAYRSSHDYFKATASMRFAQRIGIP